MQEASFQPRAKRSSVHNGSGIAELLKRQIENSAPPQAASFVEPHS